MSQVNRVATFAEVDAALARVKELRVSNAAACKQIDRANEFVAGPNCIKRKFVARRTEKQDRTLHDVLQSNPVLLRMYKQGRLF